MSGSSLSIWVFRNFKSVGIYSGRSVMSTRSGGGGGGGGGGFVGQNLVYISDIAIAG